MEGNDNTSPFSISSLHSAKTYSKRMHRELWNVDRKSAVFLLIVIILLICSAYSNTFSSPPVLDDFHSFVFEQSVHSKDLSLSSLRALSGTFFGPQRWIPMVTFAIDLQVGNGDVFYFHLTNLIIHLLCTIAVVFLAFNLLQSADDGEHHSARQPLLYAILVAGFWALNPVQTNAVTYLVQRMASIQSLFFITSVAFYVLGRTKQIKRQERAKVLLCYLACLLSSIGALLSKENSAMLPAVLLVTEAWFFTPRLLQLIWGRLREAPLIVWGILSLGVLTATIYSAGLFQHLEAGYASRDFTMLERLLTQARVVIWYISLLLWPMPSRLSLEHDLAISSSLVNPPSTLPAIVCLLFLGWLIIRYRKESRLITYGGLWFFLNLVVESTIVPLELVFEHRLYLPSVGFSLAVVCALQRGIPYLFGNRSVKDVAIACVCGFLLIFSGLSLLTFFRNEVWKDTISICSDASQKAPRNPRARANLASAYGLNGKFEESIREGYLAIELGKGKHLEAYVTGVNAIIGSLMNLERFDDAVKQADILLANLPEHFDAGGLPDVYLKLAQAHFKLGNLNEAYSAVIEAFHYAKRKRNPVADMTRSKAALVVILMEAKDRQIDLNKDGIVDPGNFSIMTWIAKEFLKMNERNEARSLLTQASKHDQEDQESAQILAELDREDEINLVQMSKEGMRETYQSSPFSRFNASMALAYLARTPGWSGYFRSVGEKLLDYALDIQPEVADAHLLKAYYVHDRKEIEPAIAATERALAVDPDYSRAWLALGSFRMELNDFPGAVTAFKRGLELYPGCPQRASVLAAITAIEQNPALTTAQN